MAKFTQFPEILAILNADLDWWAVRFADDDWISYPLPMARIYPPTFPHDLARRPKLRGEALVHAALCDACDNEWTVFYDHSIRGSRRRIDFILAHPDRGIVVIEVKGGMVHDQRGAFRQLISKTGQRKRVDPFAQLKFGLQDLCAAVDIMPDTLPVHQVIWFPEMGQGGLRWQPSPHILTHEYLEPARLWGLIDLALPVVGSPVVANLIARFLSGTACSLKAPRSHS